MTDKSNHWSQLANLLGAKPSPEPEPPVSAEPTAPLEGEAAAGPRQETTAEVAPPPPPAKAAPPRRQSPPKPPRPAPNWDNVAVALGLTPPPKTSTPEPEVRKPAVEEVVHKAADVLERPSDLVEPTTVADESRVPRRRGHRGKWDRHREQTEREPVAGGPETAAQGEEPATEIPWAEVVDEAATLDEPVAAEPPVETAETAVEQPSGGLDTTSVEAQAPLGEPVATSEEPITEAAPAGEEPPRRRRRRGDRKRRKRSRAAAEGAIEGAEAEPPDETAVAAESDELESYGSEGEESDADGKSADAGFRGIPTWEEAIGVIVATNLESRARRPSGPPRNHRGGRGDRENRGSRGSK